MNPFILNPLVEKILAVVAVLVLATAGYFLWHHHVYGQGVAYEKTLWDADTAQRLKAEQVAIAKRLAENAAAEEANRERNSLITKDYDAQISKLRTALAAAPRLRVGPAICGRTTAPADPKSPGSGDAADTTSRVVPDDVDRDIKSLMLQVETALATARAAQQFIKDNGMAP
jgi:hypothetical protein